MKKSFVLLVPSLFMLGSCSDRKVDVFFQYSEVKRDKKGNDYFVPSEKYSYYRVVFTYDYGYVLTEDDVKERSDQASNRYPRTGKESPVHIVTGYSLTRKKTSNDLKPGIKLKKKLTFYFNAI